MNNLFASPDLFDDLYTRGVISCGTVRQNHKEMPRGFDSKTLKLKWGDIHHRMRGNLTVVVLKDR
jgi:hypothetical protein